MPIMLRMDEDPLCVDSDLHLSKLLPTGWSLYGFHMLIFLFYINKNQMIGKQAYITSHIFV
ncbi:hypothetical protein ACJX0J_018100, partial [Zea mays]